MTEVDEVVQEFLVESNENLDTVERDLVELEKDPSQTAYLAGIFRAVHTVKGTCGFLGYQKLEGIAHVGENLLSRLRDGQIKLTSARTTALLEMVDSIRKLLRSIESTGTEGDLTFGDLEERLALLQSDQAEPEDHPAAPAGEAGHKPASSESSSSAPTQAESSPEPVTEAAVSQATAPEHSSEANAKPETKKSGTSDSMRPLGEVLVQSGEVTAEQVDQAVSRQKSGDPRKLGEILVRDEGVRPRQVQDALDAQAATKTTFESTIRVSVGLLDTLMNLVGELVLVRNQILQHALTTDDTTFSATTQRLNLVTTELQEGVMKTRMQPIGNVWSKFPRVVRDLAAAFSKKVKVEMEGRDTELDKTIIEAIKDPLTHLVRNAVDHGIELPAEREAAGKPGEATVWLRAFHEGGQVNIEIQDDGGGIAPEKIRSRAVEKGVVGADAAMRMSDREVLNLIFLPGFSTAEKLTHVSGRGVGMDVVKTNIERIGGTIDLQSAVGRGTVIRIKIPLTLAIIPALVVETSEERFAIPQVSLVELVRLEGDQLRKIEAIHGTPVYRLRGNLLPLVYLDDVLGLDGEKRSDAIQIVVLQSDEHQFGLVVDEIRDTEEIVVKPLGKELKEIDTFAGATIMGDGRVALILDVPGIARRAGIERVQREAARTKTTDTSTDRAFDDMKTLLLFACGADQTVAVSLSQIDRLEEFSRERVERAGSSEVVQYRDRIMPLVRLPQMLYGARSQGDDPLQVIVYRRGANYVGLVVDRLVDIVETTLTVDRVGARSGVLGTAIVGSRVVELLDIDGIVGGLLPADALEAR